MPAFLKISVWWRCACVGSVVLTFLCLLTLPRMAYADGECPETGKAYAELDVNNVRAGLYNNGNLFFGRSDLYEVPKGSGNSPLFAAGIWFGGLVGGQLRAAVGTYEDFDWRPGPLSQDGSAPADCEPFDRLWKVDRRDIEAYEETGEASDDLREWPTGLGAPTLDSAGNLIEQPGPDRLIDLEAGERPEIMGDQSIWWVMNDVASPHNGSRTMPIGLEAQVTAFAFDRPGALANTTFYRYRFTYRGAVPLREAWFGVWSDPDVGGGGDDYVGSDAALGLGYAYNARPTDNQYGSRPPAIGFDFVQGPRVGGSRIGTQSVMTYRSSADPQGNPMSADEYYRYLQGLWRDGAPMTVGGTGHDFSNTPTTFIYSGEPPEFWSEFDIDDQGTPFSPGDRLLLQGTGPFSIAPGEVQEIIVAIIWAQDTEAASDPHLASVQKLKRESTIVQQFADFGLRLPDPPDAPNVSVAEEDTTFILSWDYPPESNNYQGSYEAWNPLLANVPDSTYEFEGFIVYRFESPDDQEGEVVAVFDRANGVTRIVERTPAGVDEIVVEGTDSGVEWSTSFTGVANFSEHHFGVQAYAYNPYSTPRAYLGPIARVTATPAPASLSLDDIGIVPNPYRGASLYERDPADNEVRITNLPERATIRIFKLSGGPVQTIEKNGSENFVRWDLRNDDGRRIGSGLYLIHVETDAGSRVLKFGAAMRRPAPPAGAD